MTALYKQWIEYLFNRPTTNPQWYFSIEIDEFPASPDEMVHLIGKTFEQCGADLAQYTDAQIADGLSYIFFNHASNVIYTIVQKGASEESRIQAAQNIKFLYRDCFAKRCTPQLSHIAGKIISPLNYFCYALWEESPIGRWKDAVIDVMEFALYLPNIACAESALRGLGQQENRAPERVAQVIDAYLAKSKNISPELRQYALDAKRGQVY